eukprot:COSAG05_NODE_10109_length_581_cov_3.356108_1_plen_88_part_01
MHARIYLIYTGICARNNIFYKPELTCIVAPPPHDGNDGGAPCWPRGALPRDEPARGLQERVDFWDFSSTVLYCYILDLAGESHKCRSE